VAQVVRSPRAEEDLQEIWLYIAADNVDAADRVLDDDVVRIVRGGRNLIDLL
jgi:plasmid stabilization system protein ParE